MEEKKGLSLGALTAAVVTSSIGSGVFTLTSSLASGAAPGPVCWHGLWLVLES